MSEINTIHILKNIKEQAHKTMSINRTVFLIDEYIKRLESATPKEINES